MSSSPKDAAVTQANNVVELASSRTPRRELPPLLDKVREISQLGLAGLLKHFFDNLDDALFELADRSRSDADQQLYFESMRELRICRGVVERDFLAELDQRFYRLPEPRQQENKQNQDDVLFDSLTLVRNDDLEVSVAVAGIVSKISSRFSLQLTQLSRRLDVLCPRHDVRDRDNPLGPHLLCECFTFATQSIQLNIKVRIILLKLFERLVVEQMGPLYDDVNRILAEAGVLRNLRDVFRVKRSPDRPERAETSSGTNRNANAADTANGSNSAASNHEYPDWTNGLADVAEVGILQSLLARQRSTPAHSGAPILSSTDVLQALANVQREAAAHPINLQELPSNSDLRQLILHNALAAGSVGRGFAGADEDTVNLVGMIFDFILNDRNLAIPMKALLARLQIPFLKLALIDRRFFTNAGHPARQLLNELSSAGIGWSSSAELKRDNLYDLIESTVVRILHRFDRDQGIFKELLDELRAHREQDDRRNKVVEQRIRDSEHGRDKARGARVSVRTLLQQKTANLELPLAVSEFVRDSWSKVLLFICIRNGSGSNEWQNSVQSLDELLWAVQPLSDRGQQAERDSLIPRLLNQLSDGLQLVGAELRPLTSLRDALSARVVVDREANVKELPPVLQPVPVEETATVDDNLDAPADLAPQFLAQVDTLSPGTWIEFSVADGEALRAKLTAVTDEGRRFIFVNRRGMKVQERHRYELASDLQHGRAVRVDERKLFERALERVITTLREKQG